MREIIVPPIAATLKSKEEPQALLLVWIRLYLNFKRVPPVGTFTFVHKVHTSTFHFSHARVARLSLDSAFPHGYNACIMIFVEKGRSV